jgi:hypothetical protein
METLWHEAKATPPKWIYTGSLSAVTLLVDVLLFTSAVILGQVLSGLNTTRNAHIGRIYWSSIVCRARQLGARDVVTSYFPTLHSIN